MKILIDTNIFIPLETTNLRNVEAEHAEIYSFFANCIKAKYSVFLHPEIIRNIERDKDVERKALRTKAVTKYPLLENVKISDKIREVIPVPDFESHDYVDFHLLNAVYVGAVNILVSNDKKLHKQAKILGIEDRIYFLADTVNLFEYSNLVKAAILSKVDMEFCYNIDVNDKIFDQLREDYRDFNGWFEKKCKNEHRLCFVIKGHKSLDGIAILKTETDAADLNSFEMSGKTLKICTFTTGKHVSGNKYGELLLRAVFSHAYENSYRCLYVTAFEKNYICTFMENFGFRKHPVRKKETGEAVLIKSLEPYPIHCSSLDYHILFGPKYVSPESSAFIIPIKPEFHAVLFPELESQLSLFPPDNACSNGIKKAYICKSHINKITSGDLLYFYRSHKKRGVHACGVVEETLRTQDLDEIIAVTAKRTVFSEHRIKELFGTGEEIFVILFRQANSFERLLSLKELGVKSAPQSICEFQGRRPE